MLLYSTAAGMEAPGLGEEATEVTEADTLEASPEATELLMVRLCVLLVLCSVRQSRHGAVCTVVPYYSTTVQLGNGEDQNSVAGSCCMMSNLCYYSCGSGCL